MFSIKSPSEYLDDLKGRLTKEQKTAFLSVFIIGFFCHLFILTNSMYNNDDIRNLYATQDRTDLGRWLLPYAAGLSSFFSLPIVNGILSLLFLSLTGMVLVRIFDLHNRYGILLISGILAVFPSVACIFAYMFTADAYFISCFLAALSVYFVTRIKHRRLWIAGAVCLCCSVGIYQAYLTFVLLLLLLFFLLALLQPAQYTQKDIVSLLIRYVLMLGSGMAAYYLFLIAALRIKQTALSSYQGVDQSAAFSLHDIKSRIVLIYRDFIQRFRTGEILAFNRWIQIASLVCVLLLAVLVCTLFLKNRVFASPLRSILLV